MDTKDRAAEAGRVNTPESKSQLKRLAVQRWADTKDFQPLTDEEIASGMEAHGIHGFGPRGTAFLDAVRWAERHHGILPKEK
jgi:SRSO17 transposase